jgi:hypothetical protein
MIDISEYDEADVLAALYNNSKPLGMGALHFDATPMSREEARGLLVSQDYFDYLRGRVMKVRIKKPLLDPRLYDRDNGEGAAERAIASIEN